MNNKEHLVICAVITKGQTHDGAERSGAERNARKLALYKAL